MFLVYTTHSLVEYNTIIRLHYKGCMITQADNDKNNYH